MSQEITGRKISLFGLKISEKEKCADYELRKFSFMLLILLTLSNVAIAACLLYYSESQLSDDQTLGDGKKIRVVLLFSLSLLLGAVVLLAKYCDNWRSVYCKVFVVFFLTENSLIFHYFRLFFKLQLLDKVIEFENFNSLYLFCLLLPAFFSTATALAYPVSYYLHLISYAACLFLVGLEELYLDTGSFNCLFYFAFIIAANVPLAYFIERKEKTSFLSERDLHSDTTSDEWIYNLPSGIKVFFADFVSNRLCRVSGNLKKIICKEYAVSDEEFDKMLSLSENDVSEQRTILTIPNFLFSGVKSSQTIPQEIQENIEKVTQDSIRFRVNQLLDQFRVHAQHFRKFTLLGTKSQCGDKEQKMQQSLYVRVSGTGEVKLIITQEDNQQSHQDLKFITTLTAKISHEIKNPLIAVESIVSEEVFQSEGQQHLVNNYISYAMILIKDFEYFAKNIVDSSCEQGGASKSLDYTYDEVNLREVINFSVSLVESIGKTKNSNVPFVVQIDEGVPELINSDELRIKQVLINLLSNSLKFTKIGCIKLKCNIDGDDKDFVWLQVEDTGIGIEDENLKQISQPFFKVKDEISPNRQGAGLGLNIVKDIVGHLGKDLTIESVYGKGTCVNFKLHVNISEKQKVKFYNECTPLSKPSPKSEKRKWTVDGQRLCRLPNTHSTINSQNEDSQLTIRLDVTMSKPNLGSFEICCSFEGPRTRSISSKSVQNLSKNQVLAQKQWENLSERQTKKRTNSPQFKKCVLSSPRETNKGSPRLCTVKENAEEINILLVEDEENNRKAQAKLLKRYVKEKGIKVNVSECKDGVECLYLIYKGLQQNKKYHVVITDESMNFIGGKLMSFVLKELTASRVLYPLKIFSSSAHSYKETNYLGVEIYEGLFDKPLTYSNIKGVLQQS